MIMQFLCAAAEVPLNSVRRVGLPGRPPLAVYNLNGRFLATDDRCTHGQASLSQGLVEDGSIVCPLHFGAFDIASGEPTAPPCSVRLKTYTVVCEGTSLYLQA
jgi:nitrite reductase/ring-hydroxylating ferredoxin subunit